MEKAFIYISSSRNQTLTNKIGFGAMEEEISLFYETNPKPDFEYRFFIEFDILSCYLSISNSYIFFH